MTMIVDKCNWSCNFLDELPTKMCIPGKTEDVNVELFNMITRINEVKTLVKNISSDCKGIFDCEACNSNKSVESIVISKKKLFGILPHFLEE